MARAVGFFAIFLGSATVVAGQATPTPSSSPQNTAFATTRWVIDNFNLTFNLQTDEWLGAIGAVDPFGDGFGTLRATGVMFQTPVGNGLPFVPTRCDVLLFKQGGPAAPTYPDGYYLSLYADDGSAAHNPGVRVRRSRLSGSPRCTKTPSVAPARPSSRLQLSAPLQLSAANLFPVTTPKALLTYRSNWYQIPVTGTGATTDWPQLAAGTNYWAVLSPGTTLTFSQPYPWNAALWGGIDITTTAGGGGANVRADNTGGNLFTARELHSSRFAGDTTYQANKQAAVNFVQNTNNWASVDSRQFTNWQKQGSGNIRYGLQVIGWNVNPTNTATGTGKAAGGLGVT